MGILERLLETDMEKLQEREKKVFEVKRLTKILGEPFFLELHPLAQEQINHIAEISKTVDNMQNNTVLEGALLEGKRLNYDKLLQRFKVVSAEELIKKLFLPGEIYEVYKQINKMSGYDEDTVQEVKN